MPSFQRGGAMHVCLICVEFFGLGVHGGFGRATRYIGRELTRRGIQVTVVVPRRPSGRPDVRQMDGMTIRQFPAKLFWASPWIYRQCKADIYHSQDASLGTFLAMLAAPKRKHMVTFRDPMDRRDWEIETQFSGKGRLGWEQYRRYIDNPLVRFAVRSAQGLYCAAEFLIPKVMLKYGLQDPPIFLPTPVDIPDAVHKAPRPTVCFLSRWEGRKRPELFFELARKFPSVDFIAVGGAQDPRRDRFLRDTYASIANLQMPGIIDQFRTDELSRILSKSWVLVNTSAREGLPNAFLEAAAHRCAILSFTDPDQFASRFGCHVPEGDLEGGLEFLLTEGRWKKLGEDGQEHVRRVFSADKAIQDHWNAYNRILSQGE